MASPVVESSATGSGAGFAGSGTPASMTLPATVSVGALLIVVGRVDAGTSVSFPAGWTVAASSSADASNDLAFWAYKNTAAVGNEDGTSISVTFGGTPLKWAQGSLSITGAADPAQKPPEGSTVATGASTTPDPTTVSPAQGGTKDYLFLWAGTWEGEQTSPPTGQPSGYTSIGGSSTGTAGNVDTNVRVALARKAATAETEDPGSWTISASDDWMVWALAVHPTLASLLPSSPPTIPALPRL